MEEEEKESQAKKKAQPARTLAQDGQYAQACQALNSAGMAPDTTATCGREGGGGPALGVEWRAAPGGGVEEVPREETGLISSWGSSSA